MIVIIHYNGRYKDSIVIKGNSIEEFKEVAYEEVNKRGWEKEHCWSEVQNEV